MGEHKVGYTAVGVGVDFGVEEAVERHGEGDEVLLVTITTGKREGEIETHATLNILFVGGGIGGGVEGAGEGLVVENTHLKCFAVFAKDKTCTGLEVVAANGHVEGLEAEFLTLVVDTGIETDIGGHTGSVEANAEVAELLKGIAKGAMVRTIDVVRHFEALLGNADGED